MILTGQLVPHFLLARDQPVTNVRTARRQMLHILTSWMIPARARTWYAPRENPASMSSPSARVNELRRTKQVYLVPFLIGLRQPAVGFLHVFLHIPMTITSIRVDPMEIYGKRTKRVPFPNHRRLPFPCDSGRTNDRPRARRSPLSKIYAAQPALFRIRLRTT